MWPIFGTITAADVDVISDMTFFEQAFAARHF